MDSWYLTHLVCPRDQNKFEIQERTLTCAAGHRYPVVNGIPVLLLDDVSPTIALANKTVELAGFSQNAEEASSDLYLQTLGISEDERKGILSLSSRADRRIDPVVSYLIAATNGYMYKGLIGRLPEYPIPEIRLPSGNGETLLDIGCNWGRWCISAQRRGYAVVGIDPSLGAIMAARRVANELALPIKYVVADGRYLPFSSQSISQVFSYSVLQHFSQQNVVKVLEEVTRVLKSQGKSLVQMPNFLGLRCLYHQTRRGFREPRDFEVRYWSIPLLKKTFGKIIGRTQISVDCFGGLGIQPSDRHLMSTKLKFMTDVSETLRKFSTWMPPLSYVSDSVYVQSVKA